MVSLDGVKDFAGTTAGMVVIGLAGLQVAGMITGGWNLIPFVGAGGKKNFGPNFVDYPAKYPSYGKNWSDWYYGSEAAKGVGGFKLPLVKGAKAKIEESGGWKGSIQNYDTLAQGFGKEYPGIDIYAAEGHKKPSAFAKFVQAVTN